MREKKIKQPKHGLKIEKNLRVVKTAGFRAEKKRDKSVNRRAGLHDKLKNLRGERRVVKAGNGYAQRALRRALSMEAKTT